MDHAETPLIHEESLTKITNTENTHKVLIDKTTIPKHLTNIKSTTKTITLHDIPKEINTAQITKKTRLHQVSEHPDEGNETDQDYIDFIHSFDGYTDDEEESENYQSAAEEYEIGYMIQVTVLEQ